MLGSIGYFAVGSIGKLPLITIIFENLVKPLKKVKLPEGGIEPQISGWKADVLTTRPRNFILERGKNIIIV